MTMPERPQRERDRDQGLIFWPRQPGAQRLLLVALAAFGVGVFLWGSIVLAMVSGVQGMFEDDSGDSGGDGVVVEAIDQVDCEAFGAERALSPEQEAAFQEQCVTPDPEAEATATATPTPSVPPTPTIEPTDENRFNCGQIRGTQYLSEEERTWFLDNCLTPTP